MPCRKKRYALPLAIWEILALTAESVCADVLFRVRDPIQENAGAVLVAFSPFTNGWAGLYWILPFFCWFLWRTWATSENRKWSFALLPSLLGGSVAVSFILRSVSTFLWPVFFFVMIFLTLRLACVDFAVRAYVDIVIFCALALLACFFNFESTHSFLSSHLFDGNDTPWIRFIIFCAVLAVIVAGAKLGTGHLMKYRTSQDRHALLICASVGYFVLLGLFTLAFTSLSYWDAATLSGSSKSWFVGLALMLGSVVLDCTILDRFLPDNRKCNCRLAANMNVVLFFLLVMYMPVG